MINNTIFYIPYLLCITCNCLKLNVLIKLLAKHIQANMEDAVSEVYKALFPPFFFFFQISTITFQSIKLLAAEMTAKATKVVWEFDIRNTPHYTCRDLNNRWHLRCVSSSVQNCFLTSACLKPRPPLFSSTSLLFHIQPLSSVVLLKKKEMSSRSNNECLEF